MTGIVYLVGAGPGAPDLVTLRAARVLASADIVFHDALVHPDTLALAPRAELVPVGKRCGRLSSAQRFINKRLVDAARTHRVVVRLKGGDPMIFGRAQEEIDALREAGVPFEIVSGVTAASAVGAALATSLTRRPDGDGRGSRSVVFVTPRVGAGIGRDDDAARWIAAVRGADTAVLYMASHDAAAIAATLIAHGHPASTPVAAVENASLPTVAARVTTLADVARDGIGTPDGPTTLVVGDVMRAAELAASPAMSVEERCRVA